MRLGPSACIAWSLMASRMRWDAPERMAMRWTMAQAHSSTWRRAIAQAHTGPRWCARQCVHSECRTGPSPRASGGESCRGVPCCCCLHRHQCHRQQCHRQQQCQHCVPQCVVHLGWSSAPHPPSACLQTSSRGAMEKEHCAAAVPELWTLPWRAAPLLCVSLPCLLRGPRAWRGASSWRAVLQPSCGAALQHARGVGSHGASA